METLQIKKLMPTTVEETEKNKTSETPKDELLLDSLEIKGYRCFEHLTIEKLGRVNLIVGKNNVGKTALLEAIIFYIDVRESHVFESLKMRNEISKTDDEILQENPLNSEKLLHSIRHLFSNHPVYQEDLGSTGLSIESPKLGIVSINFSPRKFIDLSPQKTTHLSFLSIKPGNRPRRLDIATQFVRTSGLSNNVKLSIWDKIERQLNEDKVVEALKVLDDKLEDIRFSGYPDGASNRVPVVKMKNAKERTSLKSLGEGMSRMLDMVLSLVKCKNGVLLIDEIENGLHYSVLPDVWKLIFKTAKDLNVQVFATTHSKDCIEAFAQAAYDSPEDGMLIRLERQGEKIVAKTFEEETLVDAVNYDVEVR